MGRPHRDAAAPGSPTTGASGPSGTGSCCPFDSSKRLKSGETQISYRENTEAKAGAKGALAIPDTFELALQPFEGGDGYMVGARFRYRINGTDLHLGYRLTRPRDVLRDAFSAIVAKVEADTARKVWQTS